MLIYTVQLSLWPSSDHFLNTVCFPTWLLTRVSRVPPRPQCSVLDCSCLRQLLLALCLTIMEDSAQVSPRTTTLLLWRQANENNGVSHGEFKRLYSPQRWSLYQLGEKACIENEETATNGQSINEFANSAVSVIRGLSEWGLSLTPHLL